MSLLLEEVSIEIKSSEKEDPSRKQLIRNMTLEIGSGKTATVMGPSGSGKSTLLSVICGTQDSAFHVTGSISLNGRLLDGLAPEKRRIGILFQDDLLFPHLTVGENLEFALPKKYRKQERQSIVEQALKAIELEAYMNADSARISGGQRARVSLMRTLLAEPEALVLDEPFSKLDQDLRSRFRTFVFEHARQRNLPVLLVTHDLADAEAAGGPVIYLMYSACMET